MTQVRITDQTAAKLKELSWRESLRAGHRVTQGEIIDLALAALERELAAAAPEIRPEVLAAARDAGVDLT